MNLLRRGKVKDVYEVDEHTLEFHFSNRVSVFDKVIPSDIPGKGESLCRSSAHWFKAAKDMGIKTHFRELTSGNRMRVERFQIFDRLRHDSRSCMVPLEVVSRHYVAGSLYDRLREGKIEPKSLGLTRKEGLYGTRLPQPFVEVTTKFEEFDRPLELGEAMDISGLSKDEYGEIVETVLRLDDRIGEEVMKRGLIHVDGKKEFGLDSERGIVVVDTFGTADEDRFWDLKGYEDGGCLELSKEFVRQHYRNMKYHEELVKARESGLAEPDIPPLSEEMVKEVSELYIEMFKRITGEEF